MTINKKRIICLLGAFSEFQKVMLQAPSSMIDSFDNSSHNPIIVFNQYTAYNWLTEYFGCTHYIDHKRLSNLFNTFQSKMYFK